MDHALNEMKIEFCPYKTVTAWRRKSLFPFVSYKSYGTWEEQIVLKRNEGSEKRMIFFLSVFP